MGEGAGNIEAQARNMGWLPQEEFRGAPENWVPAEQFVKMAEESLPHAKGTIKTMQKTMMEQDRVIRDLKDDLKDLAAFTKGAEQRAYDKALKDLKEEQKKAVEAGDIPAFEKATADLDDLIAQHPAVTGKEKKETPPADDLDAQYKKWLDAEPGVFEAWKTENPWFTEDPEMWAFANQVDQFLHQQHGLTLPRSERLAELTKRVKKKFPGYFTNQAKNTGSPVEGDTGGSPSRGDKGYNDLPAEAKAKCDKWSGKDGKGESGSIPGFTREDFLRNYKW